MSDELIRALARRWQESREDEDGVAYVRARLRAGALDPERVALAAYVGSSSARAIEAAAGLPPGAKPDTIVGWGKGLERWSAEARARIALAAARELPLASAARLWLALEEARGDPAQVLAALGPPSAAPHRCSGALREAEEHAHDVWVGGTPSFRVRGGGVESHAHALLLGHATSGVTKGHEHALDDVLFAPYLEAQLRVVLEGGPFTSSLRVADVLLVTHRYLARGVDPTEAAGRLWAVVRERVEAWALGAEEG